MFLGWYFNQKNYAEAERCYKVAITLDPKYVAPWNNLGAIYDYQRKYEDAERCYKEAIALDPKFALPWNNLGLLYEVQGKESEAEGCFTKVKELTLIFSTKSKESLAII